MDLFSSYRKTKSVIESCDNSQHLKGARNYMNLWFKMYSEKKRNVYYIDTTVKQLYESLQKNYYIKKHLILRKEDEKA